MNATANTILNHAESMIREGGFHAFSFRQIADVMKIKSASVHYHFPTKEDLGTAVTKRYAESFFTALGSPNAHPDSIGHYLTVFQNSLQATGNACLCGILAAEAGKLHSGLREILLDFREQNLAWLENCPSLAHHATETRRSLATVIFTTMEGAMNFAALSRNPEDLAIVSARLRRLIE